MRDLGTMGEDESAATAINARGEVVGYTYSVTKFVRPFIWRAGTMRELNTHFSYADARAINNSGQVVGYGVAADGRTSAYIWQRGRTFLLPTLGGPSSYAFGINDSGDVVGNSQVSSGLAHAFLWRDGAMTDLGTLGPSDADLVSHALGINDDGLIRRCSRRTRISQPTPTVASTPCFGSRSAVVGSACRRGLRR